jgi:TonB family protein
MGPDKNIIGCIALRRLAGACALATLALITLHSTPGDAARREDDGENADPLSRAKRNVVTVVDWDKSGAKAVLGYGLLVQRDRAMVPCRITVGVANLGVIQGAQRRSQAKLIGDKTGRGLCGLTITHPVHFDPLQLDVRAADEVSLGEPVYAISSAPGQELSMTRARISGTSGAGDAKILRISRKVSGNPIGSMLFDQAGALLGMSTARPGQNDEMAYHYPMDYFLEREQQKAEEARAAQAPPPSASNAAPTDAAPAEEPVTAADKPPADKPLSPTEAGLADRRAYKQAVKDYLEDIVRASTKHVVYPDSARKAHWTGTTSVYFKLSTNGGELIDSYVDTTSGFATLDVAALLAVRKAITDLPPPQIIKDKGMIATVAVTFALSER